MVQVPDGLDCLNVSSQDQSPIFRDEMSDHARDLK
jgi:hypothetical protein